MQFTNGYYSSLAASLGDIPILLGVSTFAAKEAVTPAGTESAQVRAQLRLREMILAGELPGGTRIAELSIVEKLGVSRTPIRAALMRHLHLFSRDQRPRDAGAQQVILLVNRMRP